MGLDETQRVFNQSYIQKKNEATQRRQHLVSRKRKLIPNTFDETQRVFNQSYIHFKQTKTKATQRRPHLVSRKQKLIPNTFDEPFFCFELFFLSNTFFFPSC